MVATISCCQVPLGAGGGAGVLETGSASGLTPVSLELPAPTAPKEHRGSLAEPLPSGCNLADSTHLERHTDKLVTSAHLFYLAHPNYDKDCVFHLSSHLDVMGRDTPAPTGHQFALC